MGRPPDGGLRGTSGLVHRQSEKTRTQADCFSAACVHLQVRQWSVGVSREINAVSMFMPGALVAVVLCDLVKRATLKRGRVLLADGTARRWGRWSSGGAERQAYFWTAGSNRDRSLQ
jgi:hypothetical protein